MWNLKNKVNKQTIEADSYREQTDSCQTGEGLGGWVKKVKGFRITNW